MAIGYHDLLRWSCAIPGTRMYWLPCLPALKGSFRFHNVGNRGILALIWSSGLLLGVCGWAVTSLLQCTAFNLAGGLVCRVSIGVFEGLFGTGIVYYLSLWYHRTEMGVRVFWFLGPTALSG